MKMTTEEADVLQKSLQRLVDQVESIAGAVARGNMEVLEELAVAADRVAAKARELHDFTHQ